MADAELVEQNGAQYEEQQEYYGGEEANVEQAQVDTSAVDTSQTSEYTPKTDDDDRKLFVGGLSWETTAKELREYFGKYGEVSDCTLKTDPNTGRSRGFAFVVFKEAGSIDEVLKCKDEHCLQGKTIDPKKAKARGGRDPIKKIFVGGVDPEFSEEEIRNHFGQYGKIEEIDLPFDRVKGQRKHFCFITFESAEVVDKIVENPKQTVGGNEVDVRKATPKQNEGWGYGGGRGGFRGRGRGGAGYDGGWGHQGWGGGYNQGYGGGYNQGYGGYGGYGGYDYSQGYGGYGGWGGYDQSGYGYGGYGGYGADSSGYGWGYGDQTDYQGQQSSYGAQKGAAAGTQAAGNKGYHPYNRQ